MKQIKLRPDEQEAFAMAALAYRYDPKEGPAPVTSRQLLARAVSRTTTTTSGPRSTAFRKHHQGGLRGRNKQGRRATTRAVNGIDQT
jgi:hypothetical protein